MSQCTFASGPEALWFILALWAIYALAFFTGFVVARGPAEWGKALASVKRAIRAWREGREG